MAGRSTGRSQTGVTMPLTTAERLERIGRQSAALVQESMLVGLGTGSTAAAMIDALGARVRDGLSIQAVATSNASRERARSLGIPIVELDDIDRLDICIDGADEIDPELNLTKGAGGALLFEKLVARRADNFVIISSNEKLVEHLGTRMALPVEVVPVGWKHTSRLIMDLGLSPTLRMAGDEVYITDGGHYILDCGWPESLLDPANLAADLKAITGVVDHGLFIGMADIVLTIDPEGEITTLKR